MKTTDAAAWIADAARLLHEHAEELTELDAAIGDSDHGANMDRGFAAAAALDPTEAPDAAAYLKKVGMTLVSTVGGASGPLYGTFFLRFAKSLATAAAEAPETAVFAEAFQAGVRGTAERGKSTEGEATLLDALEPAARALQEAASSGEELPAALDRALKAAREGAAATEDLVPTKGRSSYLGERARGHRDPGAASAVLLLEAATEAWS